MQVMVTGADGHIGRNIRFRLHEAGHEVLAVTRITEASELQDFAGRAEAIIHLAGVNRAKADEDFIAGNDLFTARLTSILRKQGRPVPVVASSSVHAVNETIYGQTKRAAEQHLKDLAAATGAPIAIYRLPNVFGKWCRPNYNSVVATFCYNIARGIPISINDKNTELRLVHVDDVIEAWLAWIRTPTPGLSWPRVAPEYQVAVGELADVIKGFRAARDSHTVGNVGVGFIRALYSTYLSYLPVEDVAYPLTRHEDPRGTFVEMLRTEASGQFAYFTIVAGATRGGHYHHTKTEKFLVVRGHVRIRLADIATGSTRVIEVSGEDALVVETVPGWSHDITNVGTEEVIVMVWANEIFDSARPDTIRHEVTS